MGACFCLHTLQPARLSRSSLKVLTHRTLRGRTVKAQGLSQHLLCSDKQPGVDAKESGERFCPGLADGPLAVDHFGSDFPGAKQFPDVPMAQATGVHQVRQNFVRGGLGQGIRFVLILFGERCQQAQQPGLFQRKPFSSFSISFSICPSKVSYSA